MKSKLTWQAPSIQILSSSQTNGMKCVVGAETVGPPTSAPTTMVAATSVKMVNTSGATAPWCTTKIDLVGMTAHWQVAYTETVGGPS